VYAGISPCLSPDDVVKTGWQQKKCRAPGDAQGFNMHAGIEHAIRAFNSLEFRTYQALITRQCWQENWELQLVRGQEAGCKQTRVEGKALS